MTTNWTYPNQVTQSVEEGAESVHISWNNLNVENIIYQDKLHISTEKNLYRIARSPKHDLTTKTYFLKFTNFNFENVPDPISGIELRLNTNRRGRVMDETVQLLFNNQPIGDNKAILEISQNKIYGSSNDIWNSNLTRQQIIDKNFGIILRFRSHVKFPHSDPMLVNCVEMRIH